MPELGGSYFTFSNENNDLIWGFLAECHRRGWVYRGHDTMPWCPRCGTGLSQMEMNEGYQDREDPGLTVRFPLLDRPGEALLVWTTTPWTLAANVAAAVGEDLRYVRVRQGEDHFWLGKGTLKQALRGPFQVVEERAGSELAGWRYTGPFDELPAVRDAFADAGYEHRVVTWDQVGEDEGTGIVHIAPGCGAEDYQLGQADRPAGRSGRSTRTAATTTGFGWLSGREAPDAAEAIIDDLEQRGFFYHLEPYSHRYPHCWRCGTPLLFRLVDEWYVSMGPVYDQPRDTLTKAQVDASLRYQIMEVVDRIRWIPGFGYERELDWLLNMRDWMISKKRYYGLALPIYDCRACGAFDVIGGREELQERAVEGWDAFEGHTPHRPFVDEVKIACPGCGEPVSRIADVGNPWLDAGIVPFSTLHFREDPEHWAKWFPADFITESFPGQFRNWFYAMLAMSTVLRREEPFRTIFGYATLFGEDGRPMHKSWGNAIEFDEAAERMGVDVMRWMYASARPEDNILFGWHAADEARRGLLVLWNVYAFFVTYARLAGWTPGAGARRLSPSGRPSTAGSCRAPRASRRRSRSILRGLRRRGGDARSWTPTSTTCPPGTCACRGGGCRAAPARTGTRRSRRSTRSLVALARTVAPILPVPVRRDLRQPRGRRGPGRAGQRPPDAAGRPPELAPLRDEALEEAMAVARRAVDLAADAARPGGPQGPPAAGAPVARAAGPRAGRAGRAARARARRGQRQGRRADRRRVGARGPGRQGAAAAGGPTPGPEDPRGHGRRPRGPVRDPRRRLGDAGRRDPRARTRSRSRPRPGPGTAVAHDDGLVAVIDTTLTPELRRRGRRPRAPARRPGPAQGGGAGPRRPDRPVDRRPGARGRGVPRLRRRGHARRRDPARPPPDGRRRSRPSASTPARRGSRSAAPAETA